MPVVCLNVKLVRDVLYHRFDSANEVRTASVKDVGGRVLPYMVAQLGRRHAMTSCRGGYFDHRDDAALVKFVFSK